MLAKVVVKKIRTRRCCVGIEVCRVLHVCTITTIRFQGTIFEVFQFFVENHGRVGCRDGVVEL